jgi:hypothetical protein
MIKLLKQKTTKKTISNGTKKNTRTNTRKQIILKIAIASKQWSM